MNVHILQHVPFEGLGSMEPWLLARDSRISYTRFFESCSLPDLATVDFIIAMGGPMSVNDEAELPWLADEKQFIHTAIQRGVPVLGICLGAQLIASALGHVFTQAGSARSAGSTLRQSQVLNPRFNSRTLQVSSTGMGKPSTFRIMQSGWPAAPHARIRHFKSAQMSSASSFIWRPPPQALTPSSRTVGTN